MPPIIIAHRGNLHGPDPDRENSPRKLTHSINEGYYVEADVWLCQSGWYLGHDYPKYFTDLNFLSHPKIIIHAKNFTALHFLVKSKSLIHYFWHEEDKFTLTSHQYIWTYPGVTSIDSQSIIVCKGKQETRKYVNTQCYGICTDFVANGNKERK